MSRLLPNLSSGSAWLWAVCGLVAVSLTQGTGNHSGLVRAAAVGCCYEADHGRFPVRGSLYESLNPTFYPDLPIPIELVSMSLRSSSPLSVALPQPGTPPVHVDSFFDVFVELQTQGQPPQVHSFFDVFADFSMTGVSGSPTTGTVEIEMLSMNLGGSGPFMIRESPTRPSIGQHTAVQTPTGGYVIDSFFDVFTELSINGGGDWFRATGPVHMDLSRVGVPEPGSLMLACIVGFTGLAVQLRRRWRKSA